MSDISAIREKVAAELPHEEIAYGEIMINNCDCQILSQSAASVDFMISTPGKDELIMYSLAIESRQDRILEITPKLKAKPVEWDRYAYACLLHYEQELNLLNPGGKLSIRNILAKG